MGISVCLEMACMVVRTMLLTKASLELRRVVAPDQEELASDCQLTSTNARMGMCEGTRSEVDNLGAVILHDLGCR